MITQSNQATDLRVRRPSTKCEEPPAILPDVFDRYPHNEVPTPADRWL